jgi:hypothetical protein
MSIVVYCKFWRQEEKKIIMVNTCSPSLTLINGIPRSAHSHFRLFFDYPRLYLLGHKFHLHPCRPVIVIWNRLMMENTGLVYTVFFTSCLVQCSMVRYGITVTVLLRRGRYQYLGTIWYLPSAYDTGTHLPVYESGSRVLMTKN